MAAGNPNNDYPVTAPPNDCVSSLSFSPSENVLVAGSWNKEVRCWVVNRDGSTTPKAMHKHEAPVLCTCFSPDGTTVFSGSCDQTAKMWNLAANKSITIGKHDAPIKEIFFVQDPQCVVTGSWDKTLRYWDVRTPGPPKAVVTLPERCYAMDVKGILATVGTAERHLLIYDLRNPTKPFKELQSPLKYQSRCISNFIDKTGFAVGSIEGRVAIQYVEDKHAEKNFAFKCHRHGQDGKEVYAVNNICFHPKYGTFATAGSDGVYTFWDKDSKQRLKQFNRADTSITTATFNRDGTIYAYALSYDWSKGIEHYDKTKPNRIFLHAVQDTEVLPRKKSR